MDAYKVEQLLSVIRAVHAERGDDVCWMDIDRIFVAAGLPVPDRRVGDKAAMKKNCERFIDTMCVGGKWPTYAELEQTISDLRETFKAAVDTFPQDIVMPPRLRAWWTGLYHLLTTAGDPR